MFFETIRMSLSNLWNNKMRTFLTVLGVVIGIASMIAMMTFVQGATDEVSGQLISAGANKLSISIRGSTQKRGLTDSDIEKIASIDNIDYLSVSTSSASTVFAGEKSEKRVSVYGTDENFFKGNDEIVKLGRFLYPLDIENRTNVCVISGKLANTLFGKMSPLGYQIKISGISFTVVGVLDQNDPNVSGNNLVYLPYTTARETLNYGAISSMDVSLVDPLKSTQTKNEVEDTLYLMFNENENAYSVFDMQVILDMFDQVMGTMNGILTGIAAISLLVGGIGIMNMMLVSVSERTNEIGLRKALGAKPREISLQFVLESVIIAIIGGIIGLLLGLGIASLLGALLNVVPAVNIGIIALAVGFSAFVGLVFGIMPAKRAARLNPIDALRSN